jgi:hypothetical protein
LTLPDALADLARRDALTVPKRDPPVAEIVRVVVRDARRPRIPDFAPPEKSRYVAV